MLTFIGKNTGYITNTHLHKIQNVFVSAETSCIFYKQTTFLGLHNTKYSGHKQTVCINSFSMLKTV
jgi:hypothetical protein